MNIKFSQLLIFLLTQLLANSAWLCFSVNMDFIALFILSIICVLFWLFLHVHKFNGIQICGKHFVILLLTQLITNSWWVGVTFNLLGTPFVIFPVSFSTIFFGISLIHIIDNWKMTPLSSS